MLRFNTTGFLQKKKKKFELYLKQFAASLAPWDVHQVNMMSSKLLDMNT